MRIRQFPVVSLSSVPLSLSTWRSCISSSILFISPLMIWPVICWEWRQGVTATPILPAFFAASKEESAFFHRQIFIFQHEAVRPINSKPACALWCLEASPPLLLDDFLMSLEAVKSTTVTPEHFVVRCVTTSPEKFMLAALSETRPERSDGLPWNRKWLLPPKSVQGASLLSMCVLMKPLLLFLQPRKFAAPSISGSA